eukprot:Pgem_evm1s1260
MSKQQAELAAQNMLDIIAAWMDKWRTKLSLPKTNYLLITGADKRTHELQLTVLLVGRQGLEFRETRPGSTKKT